MIQNVKKILAPIDFSEHSMRAMKGAWDLAKDTNAELHLLHVVVPRRSFIPIGDPEAAREAAMVEQTEQELARIKKDEIGNSARLATGVVVGPPVTKICEYVKANDIDLVVMSTLGRSGTEQMLIGSVTEKLVRYAPCPILVLPRAS